MNSLPGRLRDAKEKHSRNATRREARTPGRVPNPDTAFLDDDTRPNHLQHPRFTLFFLHRTYADILLAKPKAIPENSYGDFCIVMGVMAVYIRHVMTAKGQVVVASPELERRRSITTVLLNLGLDPICVSKVSECMELINRESVDLIFCDRFFADGDYRDVLAASQRAHGEPCVILASRHNNDEYREAMESQAFGVISVPCRPTDVEWMVIQAKRNQRKRELLPSSAPARPEKPIPAQKAFSAGAA